MMCSEWFEDVATMLFPTLTPYSASTCTEYQFVAQVSSHVAKWTVQSYYCSVKYCNFST